MKYLKLFENFQHIDLLCDIYKIENYTIGSYGFIDVDGDVELSSYKRLDNLPIKFGKVSGNFKCNKNILSSLEGCPKVVGGGFWCSNNKLTSLEGCPKEVGGDFICFGNRLTSLEGCPKEVGGDFNCYGNKLTSLEGCPKEVGSDFVCNSNKLISLEWIPKEIGGNFNCSGNHLSSLDGCPKEVNGYFVCSWNQLRTLKGCPDKVGGVFSCTYNQLTIIDCLPEWIEGDIDLCNNKIRDIKVEDKNYRFFGRCDLRWNPIYDLFNYWRGDLRKFIEELEFEDFIRDDGKSLDMTRFEYALNGKKYNREYIENYKLIWKE